MKKGCSFNIILAILIIANIFQVLNYLNLKRWASIKLREYEFITKKQGAEIQKFDDVFFESIFCDITFPDSMNYNSICLNITEQNCSTCIKEVIDSFDQFCSKNPELNGIYYSDVRIPLLEGNKHIRYKRNSCIDKPLLWYIDENDRVRYVMRVDKDYPDLLEKYFTRLSEILSQE